MRARAMVSDPNRALPPADRRPVRPRLASHRRIRRSAILISRAGRWLVTRGRHAAPMVLCVLLVSLWLGVQILCRRFIYHDVWRAGFPILFSVGKQTTCTGLPLWLSGVDTGSPLVIYAINSSLTHLLR